MAAETFFSQLFLLTLVLLSIKANTDISLVCFSATDIILIGLIKCMHCLPCFVFVVLLVAAAIIHFEEQVVEAGTKQSRQG